MEETRHPPRPRRRRRRRRHTFLRQLLPLVLLLLLGTGLYLHFQEAPGLHQKPGGGFGDTPFENTVQTFARKHDLSSSDWPQTLLDAAEHNPEMEDFVLNYPLKKDQHPDIDLSQYRNADSVPLLMQWDERWGYSEYAGGLMGLSGCGPTCLSMVSLYLKNDPSLDPRAVAEFSESHGYSVSGNGSAWTLISEGGRELGLDVTEIPLDRDRVFRNLEVGNPIICIMGPGDFTSTGHYIVLVGCEDGKLRVNDPNSRSRSETLWDYDAIQDQIRNLWVCR